MTKQFCDHCAADITDVTSSSVSGIATATPNGGVITWRADLCLRCYRALLVWVKTKGKA